MTLWPTMIKYTHPSWCCFYTPVSMGLCADAVEHPELLMLISLPIKGHWLLPACQNRFVCAQEFIKHPSCIACSLHPFPSFLLLFTRMSLTTIRSHTHTHTFLPVLFTLWSKNYYSSRGMQTCDMHVKQTVTPSLLGRYTHKHSQSFFALTGWHTHMPAQQKHSLCTWLSYCYAEEDWAALRAC